MQVHKVTEAAAQAQYACPFPDCQKSFSTPYLLRRHVEGTVKHQGDAARRFPCPYCKKRFPHQFNIPLHIKRVHKIPCLSSEPRKETFRSATAKQKQGNDFVQIARCEDSPDLDPPSTSTSSQDSHPDARPCFGDRNQHNPYESISVQTSIEELLAFPGVAPPASSYKGDSSRSSLFDPTSPSTSSTTMMTRSTPVTSPSTLSPSDAQEVVEMEGNVLAYLKCFESHSMSSVEDPFNSPRANGAQNSSFALQAHNNNNGSSIPGQTWVNHLTQPPSSDYNRELVMEVINEAFQTHQYIMASFAAQQQSYQQPYERFQPQQYGQVDGGVNDQLSLDCLSSFPGQRIHPRQQLQWQPNLYEEFCRLANGTAY